MQPFTSSLVISINRNILECKVGISASHLRRRNVLIETYWNVKTGQASGGCTDWFPVLIETYWNVNSFPAARNMASVGINRNILECKSMHWWSGSTDKVSINRNILECKLHLHPLSRARAWY